MAMSTEAILERNRRNALRSTGPKTVAGKRASRANSLKHGLCANPAASVIEDGGAFEDMHTALVERFEPVDPVEAGLVHRIAVCLWRLQRAAEVEAAGCDYAVSQIRPATREEIQEWVTRINLAWRPSLYEATDEEAEQNPDVYWRWKGKWMCQRRTGLKHLDAIRDEQMHASPAALVAMRQVLDDLASVMRAGPASFRAEEAEKLVWLLDVSAETFPLELKAMDYPWNHPWAGETEILLGRAFGLPAGDEAWLAVDGLVTERRGVLRQMRASCQGLHNEAQWQRGKALARLPEAALMDRLLRYETHADRALRRAVETLARLRGVTVQTYMARVSQTSADGAVLEVEGQRTSRVSGVSVS